MSLRIFLGCLLVAVVALGGAAYLAIRWAEGPAIPTEEHPPSKVVVIPDGSTFQHVAALLERERLIKSRTAFVLIGKFQSADRKVHAGEYELNPGMTPAEILSKLLNGQVLLHPMTIPEGLTITQIADVASQQGLTDRAEFLRLAKDREFIVSLGIKAETLEGYLYPDTYKFPRAVKAYLGRPYIALALGAYHQNRISELELADYLNVPPKNLAALEEKFMRNAGA